jgi:DNA repair ATPase RecN
LMPYFDRVRSLFSHVTVESIDDLLNEWKLLARKHNVSPYLLPQCHDNYIHELEGTNQLQSILLPQARSDEDRAYQQYWNAYHVITKEREKVAKDLSNVITKKYLPLLGFTSTEFSIEIRRPSMGRLNVEDASSTTPTSTFLVDATDFLLSRPSVSDDVLTINRDKGSLVHDVASSGERARILFALECALPGSIGSASRSSPSMAFEPSSYNVDDENDDITISENKNAGATVGEENWYNYTSLLPITTIYDEIDAHIGGRAVNAMAQLLAKQSCTSQHQIMAITHNPTVAAIANTHIIIQKVGPSENANNLSSLLHLDRSTEVVSSSMGKNDSDMLNIQHFHQQQSISIHFIPDDPYNENRIEELVRMVCGSNNEKTATTNSNQATNIEATIFVKALVRNSFL